MKNCIISCLFLFSLLSIGCEAQVKPNDIPLKEDSKNYKLETVATDIAIPWGMVWLPDGSMLVTEKSGALYHIKNGSKTEIKNVPKVYSRGQGGLLDIALHPNYAKNGWIYMTYASEEGSPSFAVAKVAIKPAASEIGRRSNAVVASAIVAVQSEA